MIPKKYTAALLEGRYATTERRMRNGAGEGISAGAIVRIRRVVRGKGLEIETEKCPHCGQFAVISRVSREDLTLLPETK